MVNRRIFVFLTVILSVVFGLILSIQAFAARENKFIFDSEIKEPINLEKFFAGKNENFLIPEVVDDRELISKKFEEQKYADVIVWLKNNKLTTNDYQKDLDKKRKEIRKLQDDAFSLFDEDDFNLKYRYVVTNGFAGAISEDGFDKLMESDLADKVYLDGTVRLFLSESRPLINATDVESLGYTGQGATVCVIDTGVDYTHPSLGGCFGPGCKVVMGYDFCNGPSCSGSVDPDPMDENVDGHGTHVAGIVASSDSTYKGIAPAANIAAIKVFSNSNPSTDYSAIAAGIDFCVNYAQPFNVKVITMSLGDDGSYTQATCPTILSQPIQNAVYSGIFIDAASGNNGYTDGISYPACAPNVVSVGGTYDAALGLQIWSACTDFTTEADKIACFTNRASNLDLLAPGAQITSTGLGGSFVNLGGTSMAAPHAAGLAALLYQVNPSLPAFDVLQIMKSSGKQIFDSLTGLTFPRINARKAFSMAGNPSNWINDKRLTFDAGSSANPSVVVDTNNNLHVVWQDDRDGNNEIYYKKISPIGNNLTSDIRLTFNPSYSGNPKIAVDSNGFLHSIWSDGNYLYYKKLNNNGLSVSPDIPVSLAYAGDSDIAIDGSNNIHVVWAEGNYILYKKLNNNGINLTSIIQVATVNNPYSNGASKPSIDVDDSGSVHLSFIQSLCCQGYDAKTIYYKKLNNNGINITDNVVVSTSGYFYSTYGSDIAVDGNGNPYITWYQTQVSSPNTVLYAKLATNGSILYSTSLASGDTPSIAIDHNNDVLVAFSGQTNPTATNSEIKYAKVSNNGLVLTSDKRLTYDISYSAQAGIVVDSNNNAHVVWQENRDGNYEIYYKRSFTPIEIIGSPKIGNAITFKISHPDSNGLTYGSVLSLGTSPGIPLSDGRIIPLNYDGAFIYSLYYPQQIGLSNTFGLLNNDGNGEVSWAIPNKLGIVGLNVSLAFISVNQSIQEFPEQLKYISPPITFTISP